MKRLIITSVAACVASLYSMADITVKVAPEVAEKNFSVDMRYIDDMTKPRMERPDAVVTDYTVTDGSFTIKTATDRNARYMIPTGDRSYIAIYTKPGDNLTVNLTSITPLNYSVSGTKLMEDISNLDKAASGVMEEYGRLMQSGSPSQESVEALQKKYNDIFTGFIAANPESEGVAYALMQLEGDDFMTAYNALTPAAKKSILMPLADQQKKYVEKAIAMAKRKAELNSGNVMAPDFTYNTIDGKKVSLSDFRGKWVIIDFWGSWCPWCIKGFPKLKEAYAQYKPELEILGVACNDKPDAWEKALAKYELPWVNIYNPDVNGGKLMEEYAVEGFPTKVIVSPEGKIMNITSGEDPAFFEILAKLIKK